MKSSRLAIKWSLILILLPVMGTFGQQARSAKLADEQIALLSDIGPSRFSLDNTEISQQLKTKSIHIVDIDLTDSEIPNSRHDSSNNIDNKSALPGSAKVLILGGSAAFPL